VIMPTLNDLVREILKTAQAAGMDAYDLWREAKSGKDVTDAAAYVADLIKGCTEIEIIRIDRMVFGD